MYFWFDILYLRFQFHDFLVEMHNGENDKHNNLSIYLLQASLYIPVLIIKARKFAMLYSLGSLFVISRWQDTEALPPSYHNKSSCFRDKYLHLFWQVYAKRFMWNVIS